MIENKKFKIVTLGCRTNQYESQAYADQLIQMGCIQAEEGEVADVCIVNTCSVTAAADSTSRHRIRSLARENPGAKILVTGCAAERLSQDGEELQGVELIILNKDKERLLQRIFTEEEVPPFAIRGFAAHTRAFVKVQDGCNSFCSYCIIPYVRGRSRSRRIEKIVQEVRSLLERGYQEIVLTGINVGDFDGAPREGERASSLADLVRAIDALEGLRRLRISSIDPNDLDEALFAAVTQGKHTCPSMHLVLQSGSDAILKRMHRKYTRSLFLRVVEQLKKARPDFTFTTDIIVGFPGESEEDFEQTLSLVREVRFAKVHLFPYSVRKGTRAASFPEQIPPAVIAQRKERLMQLADREAFLLRQNYVGQTQEVLFEEGGVGYTEHFLPVELVEGCVKPNTLKKVELVENTQEALRGRIVE